MDNNILPPGLPEPDRQTPTPTFLGYGPTLPVTPPNPVWQQRPGYSVPPAQNPAQGFPVPYQQPFRIAPPLGVVQPSGPLVPLEYSQNIKNRGIATGIIIGISSFLLFGLFMLTSLIGGGGLFFLALIPLTIIVLSTVWIGKWDPEPVFMRIAAFIWGAIGSVILTFIIGGIWGLFNPAMLQDVLLSVGVQAPVVEEFAKGIFVLIIVLCLRRYITSPISGIVYAMLIGAGFAFTENILYFMQSLGSGGLATLGTTFVIRGVMSPFAHALFSLPMGVLLGWGVRTHKNPLQLIGLFLCGYIPAMGLHGLWNISSVFLTDFNMWLLFYFIIQVPIFIGAVFFIWWVRRNEALRTLKYLTEYTRAGWFTREEAETFATWKGRSYATKWAKHYGSEIVYLTKTLNKETVELANIRGDIVSGVNVEKAGLREQFLLGKISHDKKILLNVK